MSTRFQEDHHREALSSVTKKSLWEFDKSVFHSFHRLYAYYYLLGLLIFVGLLSARPAVIG